MAVFDSYLLKRVACQARLARVREAWRYALVRPRERKRFHVVSMERNAGPSAIRCLESVYRQHYDRALVRHVFIDDASTDGTDERIERWLRDHPDSSVQYVHNTDRLGSGANGPRGSRMAEPGSIVIEVDGDDWLPDHRVLSFFDRVYEDPEVWMTYNTAMKYKNGRYRRPSAQWRQPYPAEVIARNEVRYHPVDRLGHPRTYRIELFHQVPPQYLTDPNTGEPWLYARDKALFFPMMELAGTHARHVYRVCYVYDISQRWAVTDADARACDEIRRLPPCAPLDSLPPPDPAPRHRQPQQPS
ncbi:MAG: glycosyltransferase family 2 protein [Planctomycetota bacterium]